MIQRVLVRQLFAIVLVVNSTFSVGQTVSPSSAQSALNKIKEERSSVNKSRLEKATTYSKLHNLPMKFDDGLGNTVYLIDVDEFGLPVYRTTLNAGAAITTGVSQLRGGGSLGVNLSGKDMVVGIWDESKVKDHIEFGDRINSRQGDFFSGHATHVTGTILATGIQANSMGMAPLARATTWDFNNDEAEMAALAKPDQTSLLLSNHSYGVLMGYYFKDGKWEWAGNSAISTKEDYRFGFYSGTSQALDQIAFNAPYYTMVWAGGNDRANSGDGSHPADGNEGTGYDCMGPDGGAKNVLTVGAVNKVTNYTGPAGVVMSAFSSWGPTDDGRIKPDIVGAGVSVFSTFVNGSGADSYSSQQGTSIAAPNVTGSLLLVQELYRDLHAGKFMRAATLKALAIHTAKEAGLYPGPDYSFGWGLLDVEAAGKVLLAEDTKGVLIQENTLTNNQSFIYEFQPRANTNITATIAWTDPAGTPVAPALDPTNKMLVNDLDIRLVDDANNTISPWILDPLNPELAAVKANNSRDNVEKIEFSPSASRPYRIIVSHKGTLLNSKQDYSVILTFTPFTDPRTAYYWIGNSGNWNDPLKWSFVSGGAAANQVPDMNSRIIVDENSFSSKNPVISLTADATCASITWLTKRKASLSLGNHKLSVDGSIVVISDSLEISNGTMEMVGESSLQNQFSLKGSNLSTVDVLVNSSKDATWTFNGTAKIKSLTLQRGNVIAKGFLATLNRLDAISTNNKMLDLTSASIEGLTQSTMVATNLDFRTNASTALKTGTATLNWPGITFNGTLEGGATPLTISGGATLNKVIVNNQLNLSGNNTFNEFTTNAGAAVAIQTASVQTLTSKTTFNTDASNRLSVSAIGGGSATLNFSGHFKGCFDFLDVTDVGITGDVTISAGVNSTLTNAPKWFAGTCADALYADFNVKYPCKNALTEFTDTSEGNVISWIWDFGDPSSGDNASTEQDAFHIFNNTLSYPVTLTVNDGVTSVSTTKDVVIGNNMLSSNKVVESNDNLFSELTADAYQWFKDGEKLDGEIKRFYAYKGEPGNYFVVINNATCNLPSSLYVVTSVEESKWGGRFKVYPNPAFEVINLHIPEEDLPLNVSLVNSLGQLVFKVKVTETESVIDSSLLGGGLYILDISGRESVRKKLVIKD